MVKKHLKTISPSKVKGMSVCDLVCVLKYGDDYSCCGRYCCDNSTTCINGGCYNVTLIIIIIIIFISLGGCCCYKKRTVVVQISPEVAKNTVNEVAIKEAIKTAAKIDSDSE